MILIDIETLPTPEALRRVPTEADLMVGIQDRWKPETVEAPEGAAVAVTEEDDNCPF